jgi:predicted unusual protein kinase regulating ubiquinone biosynthesis (AarF/ABC1/UbiB family)
MTPFDGDAAREIVRRELSAGKDDASEDEDLQSLVEKIDRPVAAASIGQVYKAATAREGRRGRQGSEAGCESARGGR